MNVLKTAVTEEYPIIVEIAATPKEKEAVYRLRYQIYVEEMGMQLTSVDHINCLLYDQLDKWAILLYAKSGPRIIGTIRINLGPLSKFPQDLAAFLSLKKFQKFSDGKDKDNMFAYISKLMIAPHYRNTPALHLLIAKAYELGCGQVQFCFGVCNFHLIRLYEQIGWRRLNRCFVAPGYDGVLIPLVLIMDDLDFFRAVRSPLHRIARKRKPLNNHAGRWFAEEFPECSAILNSQLISEEALWAFLQSRLQHKPNHVINALKGLSEVEARQFLHACSIVNNCHAGEYITLRGYVSHSLCILISGKISSGADAGGDAVQPGQCFGAAGLVDRPRYQEDIRAVTKAEILIISGLNFQKFHHAHPHTAQKILRNIFRSDDSR